MKKVSMYAAMLAAMFVAFSAFKNWDDGPPVYFVDGEPVLVTDYDNAHPGYDPCQPSNETCKWKESPVGSGNYISADPIPNTRIFVPAP